MSTTTKPNRKEFRAKLFRNGRSQAVRLPKDLRFEEDQKEVRVHREGKRLILEPVDEWPDEFWRLFGSLPDLEVPKRTPLVHARDRFHR